MHNLIAVAPVAALFISTLMGLQARLTACLPPEIKIDEVVSTQTIKSPSGKVRVKQITIRQKLIEIKALCRRGKLLDPAGREIRFYRLAGCWGNPPADYQEILARQQSELEEMRKRFTVIEIECSVSKEIQ